MGTETCNINSGVHGWVTASNPVKLNNPLMGTETTYALIAENTILAQRLN